MLKKQKKNKKKTKKENKTKQKKKTKKTTTINIKFFRSSLMADHNTETTPSSNNFLTNLCITDKTERQFMRTNIADVIEMQFTEKRVLFLDKAEVKYALCLSHIQKEGS